MKEIERKFLVADLDACLGAATDSIHICQGYLSRDPERTVRVRIKGPKGYITVKGLTRGCSRFEWEKEIPLNEAEALLELCDGGFIDKNRYLVPFAGHIFEVDVFHARHEGLVVAEIELQSESEPFARPAWLGAEVTSDPSYYNSNL